MRTHKIRFKLESVVLSDNVNLQVPTQHFDSIVHHFPREYSPSKIFGCDDSLDSTALQNCYCSCGCLRVFEEMWRLEQHSIWR